MRPARRRWAVALVVPALALSLAACSGADEQGTPAQRLDSWVSSTQVGQSVGTLVGDGAAVARAQGEDLGPGALHTVCGVLTTDAEAANANLPSPDQQVTVWLSQAYQLEYEAGGDCYSAGTSGLQRSASRRAQAVQLMDRALIRIQALTGREVATTTTTQPGSGLLG